MTLARAGVIGGGLVAILCLLALAVMISGTPAALYAASDCGQALPASTSEPADPGGPAYVEDYLGAARMFDLGPDGYAYLASINYVESAFGTSALPGVHSGANAAGAAGPMQIGIGGAAGDTWDRYKVADVPGGVSPPSVYDEADAVYAAANDLHASGAPQDWPAAILAYNHAGWYVAEVTARALGYLGVDGLARLAADLKAAGAGSGASEDGGASTVFVSATVTQPASLCCASGATPPTPVAGVAAADVGGTIDAHGGDGFTPAPGTNFTVNLEPNIAQRLNLLGGRRHLAIWGISGYRTPAHSVEAGGFADDPHTRGGAADIGVGGLTRVSAAQITDAQLASVGLARPFDPGDDPANPEVNHVQIIEPDGALLDLSAQPPIPTPAQAPATPTPAPPPIPGASSATGTSGPAFVDDGSAGGCGAGAAGDASGPTAPGSAAVILADGTAEAPADAPAAVKAMIWAGDRIDHFDYQWGGGHADLSLSDSASDPQPQGGLQPGQSGTPGYDCSGATAYVLFDGGFGSYLGGRSGYVPFSGDFGTFGVPGPGRWVTWYYSSGHVYIEVAGIYLDTAAGKGLAPNPPATGPRWTDTGSGPAGFTAQHPEGL